MGSVIPGREGHWRPGRCWQPQGAAADPPAAGPGLGKAQSPAGPGYSPPAPWVAPGKRLPSELASLVRSGVG